MDTMMAHCGLLCSECPAYKATANNDDALRTKTAEEWSKMFGGDFKAEDINCLGCKSDILFGYCKSCEIRACSTGNQFDSCAGCSTFDCDKLEGILQHSPDARERLQKLRT